MTSIKELRFIFLPAIFKAESRIGTYTRGIATKKDIGKACGELLNLNENKDSIREYQINKLINEFLDKGILIKEGSKPLTVKIHPKLKKHIGRLAVTTQAFLEKVKPNKNNEFRW